MDASVPCFIAILFIRGVFVNVLYFLKFDTSEQIFSRYIVPVLKSFMLKVWHVQLRQYYIVIFRIIFLLFVSVPSAYLTEVFGCKWPFFSENCSFLLIRIGYVLTNLYFYVKCNRQKFVRVGWKNQCLYCFVLLDNTEQKKKITISFWDIFHIRFLFWLIEPNHY